MTILKGIAIIVAFIILCLVFAISADMSHQELGALANYVWPPAVGVMAIIIFLLTSWITKSTLPRITVVIVCCLYLVYVGIALHFGRDDLPFVTF